MDEWPTPDWAASLDVGALASATEVLGAVPTAGELCAVEAALAQVAEGLDAGAVADAVDATTPRALLASLGRGPLLALRWSPPGEVSTVHHHAWTVFRPLLGSTVFERWAAASPPGPELRSADLVIEGRSVRIADGELHRQVTGPDGSIELVAIGDYSGARPRVDVEAHPAAAARADLIHAFVQAYQRADADAVAALCAEDVLADVNVPLWRFQQQGRAALADGLRTGEFAPDHRVTWWRASPTGDGAVVELECHMTHEGEERLSRQLHRLRCDEHGLVDEHTIYCTGIWTRETIEQHARSAPLIRP
ncbi:MAG: nuclear transport factor 2 family protein [Acidimicrobiales bacterium]